MNRTIFEAFLPFWNLPTPALFRDSRGRVLYSLENPTWRHGKWSVLPGNWNLILIAANRFSVARMPNLSAMRILVLSFQTRARLQDLPHTINWDAQWIAKIPTVYPIATLFLFYRRGWTWFLKDSCECWRTREYVCNSGKAYSRTLFYLPKQKHVHQHILSHSVVYRFCTVPCLTSSPWHPRKITFLARMKKL